MLMLLVVGLIAAGSVVWLVSYADITKTTGGKVWSPRLLICKLLIPIDIIITSTLVVGPLLIGIHGIQSFVCGVFAGAGLSLGTAFVRRIMVPRWQIQYQQLRG